MRLTQAVVAALAFYQLACDRSPSRDTRESARAQAPVPAYLQPLFRSLDSLLAGPEQDSLRRLPLDSAFTYREWQLTERAKPLEPGWMRTPIGDSILAHGEKTYMTTEIVLDLYQQHLRGEPLDLAGALRRVSPAYVETILPHIISVDSVLLEQEIDGSGGTDRFVREARRPQHVDTAYGADTAALTTYRLSLYLNAAAASSSIPAWSMSFDERDDGQLVRAIALGSGGTLLVVDLNGADGSETVILLASQGQVQEILRHQIDYGEGDFKLHDADGRVTIDVTGDVQLGGRTLSPTIECKLQSWPGSTLAYNDSTKQFIVERSLCMPRS